MTNSKFISESITPLFKEEPAQATYVPGEPVLPQGFMWRDKEYWVESVEKAWKESGPCRSGASEIYLRKHCYRLKMTDKTEMEVYFERQARSTKQRKTRWWLYTLTKTED
ncbi:MAG: hypothetical protein GY809_20850 [Planctomycetes bacterium]|nr:hypothetical protein [Planctomycetota bacterium]